MRDYHHQWPKATEIASGKIVLRLWPKYAQGFQGLHWLDDTTRKAHDLVERFAGPRAVDAAWDELRNGWRGLLSSFSASTGDARFDRLVNTWNPYQVSVTFHVSRSASLFE